MTLTATQQKVQDKYQEIFGRDASFGTLGGADYWTDQIDNQGLSDSELDRILKASSEGQSNIQDGVLTPGSGYLGGVNPNVGTGHSSNVGTWADHFKDGGVFGAGADLTGTIWEGMGGGASGNQGTDDSASALNAIAAATGTPINNLSGAYYNMGSTGGGDTGGGDTGSTSWWDQFADIDAFKDALGLGNNNNQSNSMNDFMQFMMFMSMMRPQGGGYGGSQYGYGGLNPGGVMSAYNPMDNFNSMMENFKSLSSGLLN